MNSPAKNKRKTTALPESTVEYLKRWIMSPEHVAHPYPTEQEKAQIMKETGIEMKQLTNWFVNNRKRYWKPRVEARLQEESKNSGGSTKKTLPKTSDISSMTLSNVVSTTNFKGLLEKSIVERPEEVPTAVATRRSGRRSCSSSITDQDHLVSDSSIGYGSSEEDDAIVHRVKTEAVHVSILPPRPGRLLPTLDDVTVQESEQPALRIYENCALHYASAMEREREVVQMKQHYLELYLVEVGVNEALVPSPMRKRSIDLITNPINDDDEQVLQPRLKFRRASIDLWKEASRSTKNYYDRELPSLDEALVLFGYKRE